MSTQNPTGTVPPPIGVMFDGTFGQTFNDLRVVRAAWNAGMPQGSREARLHESMLAREIEYREDANTDDDLDWLARTVDDAEGWLNEHLAEPGRIFTWREGYFVYEPIDD